MLDVIVTDPKFLLPVINTITQISRENSNIGRQMLMSFREVLTNIQTTNLANYMPLIHSIVLDKSIDPSVRAEMYVIYNDRNYA